MVDEGMNIQRQAGSETGVAFRRLAWRLKAMRIIEGNGASSLRVELVRIQFQDLYIPVRLCSAGYTPEVPEGASPGKFYCTLIALPLPGIGRKRNLLVLNGPR